jgi:hypothetical protein
MLVRKLQQSGRLTPGFALRSLREGKRGLFVQALAGLSARQPEAVSAALASDDPASWRRSARPRGWTEPAPHHPRSTGRPTRPAFRGARP